VRRERRLAHNFVGPRVPTTRVIPHFPVSRSMDRRFQPAARLKFSMNDVLLLFNELSVVGLFLSFVVHLLGLMGRKPPFGYFAFILQLGAFVSGVAAAFALFLLYASRGESFWKEAFRACPKWMKWMTAFLAGYAVFNFIVFVNLLGTIGGRRPDEITSIVFRGASGEWMAFYSAAFLVFFSAKRRLKRTEKN
jgi:hypothetical protein